MLPAQPAFTQGPVRGNMRGVLVQMPILGNPANGFDGGSFGMGNDAHLSGRQIQRLEGWGEHAAFARGH